MFYPPGLHGDLFALNVELVLKPDLEPPLLLLLAMVLLVDLLMLPETVLLAFTETVLELTTLVHVTVLHEPPR